MVATVHILGSIYFPRRCSRPPHETAAGELLSVAPPSDELPDTQAASPATSDQIPRAGRPRTGELLTKPLALSQLFAAAPHRRLARYGSHEVEFGAVEGSEYHAGRPRSGRRLCCTAAVAVEWREDLALLNRYRPSGRFLQIRPGHGLRAVRSGEAPCGPPSRDTPAH